MSAGTIRLTNGSTAVVGVGTAFTTDLVSADFITTTIAGTTYSLAVDSVTNATNLVLSLPFNGPTTAAAAWQAVPRKALLRVTAELNKQVTESLRLALVNSANWQAVYSGSGNITVIMPDGSTFTGPSWKYLSDNMATKSGGAVPVNQGGTGGTTKTTAAAALGTIVLNGASIQSTDTSLANFTGSMGSAGEFYNMAATNSHSITDWPTKAFSTNKAYGWGALMNFRHHLNNGGVTQLYVPDDTSGDAFLRHCYTASASFRPWFTLLSDRNTTVDSNGFIKRASPVVQVYGDGTSQTNAESDGATVTREGIGVYRISGVLGMNSDRSWGGNGGGVEVPKDINGQPRVWVDYDIGPDGSIILRTYHRTHPDAPAFARNLIGTRDDAGNFTETVLNGEPIDIPDDVFISVRVEMPQDSIYHKALSEQRDIIDSMDS